MIYSDDKCIFCKIIKKESPASIIWENENSIAFLDTNPIRDGHILLIPKKHIDNLFEISKEQYVSLFSQIYQYSPNIIKSMNAARLGIAVKGFGVAHAHIHLVPLYGPGQMNFKRSNNPSRSFLDEVAKKISSHL